MREERVSEQGSLLYVPLSTEEAGFGAEGDWDYANADTKPLTHGFHTYPVMMIPPMARRLIRMYEQEGDTLLDPFWGHGTSFVEARVGGIHAYGIDLKPNQSEAIFSLKDTSVRKFSPVLEGR